MRGIPSSITEYLNPPLVLSKRKGLLHKCLCCKRGQNGKTILIKISCDREGVSGGFISISRKRGCRKRGLIWVENRIGCALSGKAEQLGRARPRGIDLVTFLGDAAEGPMDS